MAMNQLMQPRRNAPAPEFSIDMRGIVSTGLTRFDRGSQQVGHPHWLSYMEALLTPNRQSGGRSPYQVVVIMVGANDLQGFSPSAWRAYSGPLRSAPQYGSEEFFGVYGAILSRMAHTAAARGVYPLVVGLPAAGKREFDPGYRRLHQGAQAAALHPQTGFPYLAIRPLTTDNYGTPSERFNPVRWGSMTNRGLRTDDQVHLTGAGNQLLAELVFETLRQELPRFQRRH